jgi:hypothetical protein
MATDDNCLLSFSNAGRRSEIKTTSDGVLQLITPEKDKVS